MHDYPYLPTDYDFLKNVHRSKWEKQGFDRNSLTKAKFPTATIAYMIVYGTLNLPLKFVHLIVGHPV